MFIVGGISESALEEGGGIVQIRIPSAVFTHQIWQEWSRCPPELNWILTESLFPEPAVTVLGAAAANFARTHSHKAFSPQRRGLRRGWEGAQQLLTQLATFAQYSYKHYPPNPCFFVHRVHTKAPVFREGSLVPSFVYTKYVPSLLSSCS